MFKGEGGKEAESLLPLDCGHHLKIAPRTAFASLQFFSVIWNDRPTVLALHASRKQNHLSTGLYEFPTNLKSGIRVTGCLSSLTPFPGPASNFLTHLLILDRLILIKVK